MKTVASGTFFPTIVYYDKGQEPKTGFIVLFDMKTSEYYIRIEDRTVIPQQTVYNNGFGDRGQKQEEGEGKGLIIEISKSEYENLKRPPVLKYWTNEPYKKMSLRKPCPGMFLIEEVIKEDTSGGMKRKTNKRKRKNARKSRKYK